MFRFLFRSGVCFCYGSPGEIRTLVGGSKALYACPLHHRASLGYGLLFFLWIITLAFKERLKTSGYLLLFLKRNWSRTFLAFSRFFWWSFRNLLTFSASAALCSPHRSSPDLHFSNVALSFASSSSNR